MKNTDDNLRTHDHKGIFKSFETYIRRHKALRFSHKLHKIKMPFSYFVIGLIPVAARVIGNPLYAHKKNIGVCPSRVQHNLTAPLILNLFIKKKYIATDCNIIYAKSCTPPQ